MKRKPGYALMDISKPKFPLVAIAIYLFAVAACILLAFAFDGTIHVNCTIVLFGLTLPWSLISIVFAWALIHGAGLGLFALMHGVGYVIRRLPGSRRRFSGDQRVVLAGGGLFFRERIHPAVQPYK